MDSIKDFLPVIGKSDSFEWVLNEEHSKYFGIEYDIAKVKEFLIANPREVFDAPLSHLQRVIQIQKEKKKKDDPEHDFRYAYVDWDRIKRSDEIDCSIPVFGVFDLFYELIVIDGRNRVAKAIDTKMETLPMVFFESFELASMEEGVIKHHHN